MLLLGFILQKDSGCDSNPTPEKQMTEQQMAANAEANRQTGQPGITNFTEKKLVMPGPDTEREDCSGVL